MNESDLVSIINNHIGQSTGSYYSEVNEQRANAMEAYFQKPYGNEQEGKSQIVTSEVADTIEWVMPSLMRVFTSGNRVAKFNPTTPEDVQGAMQETDVVNYYFFKKMDGFNVLYSWFKDALLQKNGIAKVYYDERVQTTKEHYKNLTQEEFESLAADPQLEPEEWEMDEETGLIEVVFVRTIDESRPMVEVIPPEEFYINPEYESLCLEEVPFACHETKISASDLIAMGYNKKEIESLNYSSWDSDTYVEKEARLSDVGGYFNDLSEDGSGDDSMKQILYAECVIRVDFDGDGIAELRKVCLANRSHVLENIEIDEQPFVSITPIPMPHRFYGRSYADQTMDLQLQKTTLLRNILDNLYLINNQRTIVLDGGANIDDLLTSRAGGVVREYTPDAVRPFPTTPFTGHPYEMLEYFDGMKEARTGITRYNQGLDANSLNKTAQGMGMIMDASQSRMELVSRLFADGVAKLFNKIHKLMLQNMDKQLIVEIRGKFVPVNPAEWKKRTDMTVDVGLGTSNDDAMMQRLQMLLEMQQQLMGMGFVSPEHIHNTLSKIVEAMGLRNVEMYFLNPDQIQPPPPPPDPQMMMVQGQLQTASEANQINREANHMKHMETMEKLKVELAKLGQKKEADMRDDIFDLTKLEVDSGKNIPGSKV